MGVSLILGLAFLLCSKASAGNEEMMVKFLLGCGGRSRGQAFTSDRNPSYIYRLEIDVSRAGEIPLPRHWRSFEWLNSLKIVGSVSEVELPKKEVNLSWGTCSWGQRRCPN
jgi:hypothetical protein